MKIGMFDSGIGGLSVLHRALKMLPNADFVYYADEDHVPYGEKTDAQLRGYVHEVVDFMLAAHVDALVIACNTATTVATHQFRNSLPIQTVGMEPAVKKALDLYGKENRRILVAATPVTIAGPKLAELVGHVDAEHQVDLVALPKLVRFAEACEFESDAVMNYLADTLSQFDMSSYAALVLGCTHFNYFKRAFNVYAKSDVRFVDGNEGTIRHLIRKLSVAEAELTGENIADVITRFESEAQAPHKARHVEFYASGRPMNAMQLARVETWMNQLDAVYDL